MAPIALLKPLRLENYSINLHRIFFGFFVLMFFILLRSGNVILSHILFLNILDVKINDKLKYLLQNVMGFKSHMPIMKNPERSHFGDNVIWLV